MIAPGQIAPDFALPGLGATCDAYHRLTETLGRGGVLLAFCGGGAFDDGFLTGGLLPFVPWFQLQDGVNVWVVTDAGHPIAGLTTRSLGGVTFLADETGVVADDYGVEYSAGVGESESTADVVLVGADRTVEFVLRGDEQDESLGLADLKRAVDDVRLVPTRGRPA